MKKLLIAIFLTYICILPVFAKNKIEVTNDKPGLYIFKIDTNKYGDKIKPYMPNYTATPRKVFENNPFDLVVNAGFFDVQKGNSVSKVVIDGQTLSTLDDDCVLAEKLKQEGRYEQVKRRAELRILQKENKDTLKFDIALADEDIPKGYKIKHSIQAGPIIYPNMDLVKEGFVIKDPDGMVNFQAVDILKRRERTMVGLKGKYLYIVLFTKENKVDANEMRDFAKEELHLDKALAFDGGLSTAITTKEYNISSFGRYQRKVKSFLIIEK